jgi:hypothetical protein
MAMQEIPRERWVEFFNQFSREHEGQAATLEVLATGSPARQVARSLPLVGISSDDEGSEAHSVSIMLGDAPEKHIDHMIAQPTRVTVTGGGNGRGQQVEIREADGTTSVVRFESPANGNALAALQKIKVIKPLPHAVMDYAWAGTMMAAPWLFGFSKNKKATINSVAAGASILALSLVTRYPLGVAKLVSFPTHGSIETVAGALTALDPWLLGFSKNKRATLTHAISGLGTLAIVALTDYNAKG